MKKYIGLLFGMFFLSSCTTFYDGTREVKTFFPEQWQGYYTLVDNSSSKMPYEFKVTSNYLMVKSTVPSSDSEFYIYIISLITESSGNNFQFSYKSAYESEYDNGYYEFRKSGMYIEVIHRDTILVFPTERVGIYRFQPL